MNRVPLAERLPSLGATGHDAPTIELEPVVVALCGEARTALEVLAGGVAVRVRTYARSEGGVATTLMIAYAPDRETLA